MAKAIKVENISKAYQLGSFGTGTISRDIERFVARVRGKEDPFLKIGELNDRTTRGESDIVWSLKDINFEIEQGDAVGIIGRNGAGKSTLLKILSRITSPTTGSIKVKGRIASLLEVGTGFHPELTGRENIFLNGAILGMRRSETRRKFDEILDFSGVERYIDTPVKRYSSGMYVRLAFAVAAHLESEILIVDEVLAVGDAEFQKKCLGKMGDVNKGDGRTVLFVSHNMTAVQKLCRSAIYLENGQVRSIGATDEIIDDYLQSSLERKAFYTITPPGDHGELPGFACEISIEDGFGNLTNEIPVGSPWQVRVRFRLNRPLPEFVIALGMTNSAETALRTTWSKKTDLQAGTFEAVFREDLIIYAPGNYYLTVGLSCFEKTFHYLENIASVHISDVAHKSLDKTIVRVSNVGLMLNPMPVTISSFN